LTDLNWHFIGQLQRNKVRKVVQLCNWVHSVDDLPLALFLDRVAGEEQVRPQVLLQVKLAPDPSKGGWSPEELEAQLPTLAQLPNLDLRGLMTIAPRGLSPVATTQLFRDLAHWEEKWQQLGFSSLNELSMGMSGDYKLAVPEGATMVRLGQVIFGSRSSPIGV